MVKHGALREGVEQSCDGANQDYENLNDVQVALPDVHVVMETAETITAIFEGRIYEVHKCTFPEAEGDSIEKIEGASRGKIRRGLGHILCGGDKKVRQFPTKFYEPMIYHVIRKKKYLREGLPDATQRALADEEMYLSRYFTEEERNEYLRLMGEIGKKPRVIESRTSRSDLKEMRDIKNHPMVKKLVEAGFYQQEDVPSWYKKGTEDIWIWLDLDGGGCNLCFYFDLSEELKKEFLRDVHPQGFYFGPDEFDKLIAAYKWFYAKYNKWLPAYLRELGTLGIDVDDDHCGALVKRCELGDGRGRKMFCAEVRPCDKPILEIGIEPLLAEERTILNKAFPDLKDARVLAALRKRSGEDKGNVRKGDYDVEGDGIGFGGRRLGALAFYGRKEFEPGKIDELMLYAERVRVFVAKKLRRKP